MASERLVAAMIGALGQNFPSMAQLMVARALATGMTTTKITVSLLASITAVGPPRQQGPPQVSLLASGRGKPTTIMSALITVMTSATSILGLLSPQAHWKVGRRVSTVLVIIAHSTRTT